MGLSQIFATNLKKYRKQAVLTQKQLAEKLNYSEKTIAKWESGSIMPSIEALLLVCSALKVDLESLLSVPESMYFLGVDGGATKTHFKLVDINGKVIKELFYPNSNSFDIGIEKSKDIIEKGIKEICFNIPYERVCAFFGIAGAGVSGVRDKYLEMLKTFNFYSFDCDSDNENVVSAGLKGQDGIAIIMGTGVCLFKILNGERQINLGYGYLFDDGGSAFNIGQDALKAYFAYLDGYGENTSLVKEIEDYTKLSKRELLEPLYNGGKKYIASFAPLVFKCAEDYKDKVCAEIIKRNVKFVAKALLNAVKDYGNKKVKVIITGGLTNEKNILSYLQQEIQNNANIELSILDCKPVEGAIIKAKSFFKK